MQYAVHFTQTIDVSVKVDADDPDSAIDVAYEEAPPGICAHCSGYRQSWSRDDSGDLEPVAVTDETGAEVWSRDSVQKGAR